MMLDRTATLALESGAIALQPEAARHRSFIPAETANQWTHAFGLLLSVVAAGVMLPTVRQQTDAWQSVGCIVYLLTQVALYAASTLSHSFSDPARRAFFRTLDQVCILLVIAGSFTPFALTHLRDGWWWTLLALIWTLAAVGILMRVRHGDGAVAFAFFAAIGWLPGLALGHAFSSIGVAGLALVLGGGLAYTGGLWFLVNDQRHPYLHAVWHLCTIAGSTCHFWFLQWYVAAWPLA